MKLQDVMDDLELAEQYVRSLPQSPVKTDVLTYLTRAQQRLMQTSDELIQTLDDMSAQGRGITDLLHTG